MIRLVNVQMELMKGKCCICLFVLVLAFFSCTEKKAKINTGVCYELSVAERDTLDISEWMYPLGLVSLETTDESLLGFIDKLIEHKGKFYVLDKLRKGVFVFCDNGKFSHRIGKLGKGSGEYTNLSDFTLDERTGYVYLLTNPSTVYVYDADGEFKWMKKINNSLLWSIGSYKSCFFCSSNYLTNTSGDDAYLLYQFDDSFQEQKRQLDVYEKQLFSPLLISSPFQKWKDGYYYVNSYLNEIYSLSCNDMFLFCNFKLDNPMPMDYFADASVFMEKYRMYDCLMEVFFSGNNLWVSYIHTGVHYTAIIDLITEKVIENGITKGLLPKVFPEKDMILSPISAEEYLENWTHLDKYLKDTVSVEDNHLILKWKICTD